MTSVSCLLMKCQSCRTDMKKSISTGYYWLLVPGLLCLATRLHLLIQLPVFIDEAIHVVFAKAAASGDWDAAVISNLLSNGTLTCLFFNGAYPYPGDKAVIEAVRGACEVREIAYFDKPDNSPGLILWRLSAGRSGPQDGKTRSTGAGSDT